MTTGANQISAAETIDFDPFGIAFRTSPSRFHDLMYRSSPGSIVMEGVPSIVVSTYDQCAAVLRDFKGCSSLKPAKLPGMQRVDFFNGLPVMNYSDPPDHTRRRRIVNPAFSPKRIEFLMAEADKLIDALLDRQLAHDAFDVCEDLARPLAIDVLLRHFLGVHQEDQHIFLDYVKTLPLLDSLKADDPKPNAFLEAWEKGRSYCRKQQDLARLGRCDNLIGVIANGSEEGAISEDEMMAMMVVLLIGGVSTMAGAGSAAIMNLARNPGVAERIRSTPDLATNHLEETLRLDPPVLMVMRFAGSDAQIGGKMIPAGTPIYVMIEAACHDPAVFSDPYRFDIDRENVKSHLAFGFGIHTCIGNTITRVIVPLLIRKIACRAPTLRLAERNDAIAWDMGTPRARHLKRLNVLV